MTEEKRKQIHSEIDVLSSRENLTDEEKDAIIRLRDAIDSDDESAGELKMWEEKYRDMVEKYQAESEERERLLDAYRRRWDETTTGTRVNGEYVDKTVERVNEYTYDRLFGGN